MELDLKFIASWRARHRGRGGLAYLLTRVRRELEARWAEGGEIGGGGERGDGERGDGENGRGRGLDGDGGGGGGGGSGNGNNAPRRVLVLDSAASDLRLSDAETRRVCALESPGAAQARLNSAGGFDGAVICLQAAWLAWPAWPRQILGALKPGGRLLFCTFGPDTLREVRAAWAQVDDAPHAHPFLDMHHIGDELLRCGFAGPIVDADWVTVTGPDAAALHADLRAEGFANALAARRKTLTGKARLAAYQTALEGARAPGAPLAVTFELIYGAAAAPPAAGRARVAVAPPAPAGDAGVV